MPNKLSADYDVYIVKYNKGTVVRLMQLESLLRYIKTGNEERREIEIISKSGGAFTNEIWKKDSMIWFSPIESMIHEATSLDKIAEQENELAKKYTSLPDVDPENQKTDGQLIRIILEDEIVDGQTRVALQRRVY